MWVKPGGRDGESFSKELASGYQAVGLVLVATLPPSEEKQMSRLHLRHRWRAWRRQQSVFGSPQVWHPDFHGGPR